jgi:hypothetical protein
MAFAPSTVYKTFGDGSILGCFHEKEYSNLFEFSANNDSVMTEFPHKIWVTTPKEGIDSGFRYGKVLKTVAHIVVDEDSECNPVVEKWNVKGKKDYV